VDVSRTFVGDDRLKIDHVANDGVLQRDAVGSEHLTGRSSHVKGVVDVAEFSHAHVLGTEETLIFQPTYVRGEEVGAIDLISVNPTQISHLSLAARSVIIDAFSHTLQTVFIVAIPFAVVAFALSWLMKEIPLRSKAHVSAEDGVPVGALEAPGEFPGL
jgi:hypothetical protein